MKYSSKNYSVYENYPAHCNVEPIYTVNNDKS